MCVPCIGDVVDRLRQLFKTKKKKSRTKPVMEEEEDFDRDNVDFLPPIVVEEKTSDQRTGATGTEAVNKADAYDRDNVDFLPPIVVDEKVMHTVSDPGVKEINPDNLLHKNVDSLLSMRRVSSLGLV